MIRAAAARAARAIPPAWPLTAAVAVNPFLGQSDDSLAQAAARLGRVAGVALTMPRAWYQQRLAAGAITDADLAAALAAAPDAPETLDVAALRRAADTARPARQPIPTIAELAAGISGIDWPGLIAERIGAWAGWYFDDGQALWAPPRPSGAYAAWRQFATRDLTPEIIGLPGFAAAIAAAPVEADDALAQATQRLGLPPEALESCFHRLLMTLGGWAQLARARLWQAELEGGTDATITDLLTIRLLWEQALFAHCGAQLGAAWAAACAAHAEPVTPGSDDRIDALLQEAAERAAQRRLAETLAQPAAAAPRERPALQAAFCIDVRSEPFRRALESVSPAIETLGFAGFFGLGVAHRRFASDVVEARLPVLLAPRLRSCAGVPDETDRITRLWARATRAWGRFKKASVSSFAFVEATGPIHAVKLLRDATGLGRAEAAIEPPPGFTPALAPAAKCALAEAVLRAMSLTSGFARLVLLAGHGASVVNNPHASLLQCGACGGHAGDVNARLLAGLLNDPAVREGLAAGGIDIPAETLFVAALHDTTTDRFTLFEGDHPSRSHLGELAQARAWLAEAGRRTRAERAPRLPGAAGAGALDRRSRDWAEIRPEWALAGCQAFIAARRGRMTGRNLAGRAFLQDYDWQQDPAFQTLEAIMTAPVIVASWISLQYYGASVAPEAFGGGNKLLHNVIGGIGVIEGSAGLLRAGLPWQSVHDGEQLAHEPLRLSVCIEAPIAAMTEVLRRHAEVRRLFDRGWLYLFGLDSAGRIASRYLGDLRWREDVSQEVPFLKNLYPGLTT